MRRTELAVSTAVGSASTMEATTTVEPSAGAIATATAETTADVATEPASNIAASRTTPIGPAGAISITRATVGPSRPIAVSPTAVGPTGPSIVAASVPAVVPRPRADKHAPYEPVRPIVAVRRARIRVIWVVSIRANRRGANPGIHRAYSNPNSHSDLRLRVARAHKQYSQQNQVL